MRILILSRRNRLYSTRRLVDSATASGYEAIVLDPPTAGSCCGRKEPAVYHGAHAQRIAEVDVVIPRIGRRSQSTACRW